MNRILESFMPLVMSVGMIVFAGFTDSTVHPLVNYLVSFLITYPSILAVFYLIILEQRPNCPWPLRKTCVALGAIHGSVFVVGTAILFAYAGKHSYDELDNTIREIAAFGVLPAQMLYCVVHLSVMDVTKGEKPCQSS